MGQRKKNKSLGEGEDLANCFEAAGSGRTSLKQAMKDNTQPPRERAKSTKGSKHHPKAETGRN